MGADREFNTRYLNTCVGSASDTRHKSEFICAQNSVPVYTYSNVYLPTIYDVYVMPTENLCLITIQQSKYYQT